MPCTTSVVRWTSSSYKRLVPGQEPRSRIAVRMVMSLRACRIDPSTERVAWPTFNPMSHRQADGFGDLLAHAVCL